MLFLMSSNCYKTERRTKCLSVWWPIFPGRVREQFTLHTHNNDQFPCTKVNSVTRDVWVDWLGRLFRFTPTEIWNSISNTISYNLVWNARTHAYFSINRQGCILSKINSLFYLQHEKWRHKNQCALNQLISFHRFGQ